jgi:TonB family protein
LVRNYSSPTKWGTEHQEDRQLGASGRPQVLQLVVSKPTSASESINQIITNKLEPMLPRSIPRDASARIGLPSNSQSQNSTVKKRGTSPRENRGILSGTTTSVKNSQVSPSSNQQESQAITKTQMNPHKQSDKIPRSTSLVNQPNKETTLFSDKTPSSGVRLMGRLLPEYPTKARRLGWEGECRTRVRISADGTVTDVVVTNSSGYDTLDASAVRALKSASFKPKRVLGIPQASTKTYRFTFRLHGGVSTGDDSHDTVLLDNHHE